jgi:hypothetical protein
MQQIANDEARSVLVKGWAASGGHLNEKKMLIAKTEKLLDQLMAGKD